MCWMLTRGVDVDAAAQQLLDVEIALGVAAARRVGVGELVDQHDLRPAREDGVEIHLLERLALVVDAPARNDLEAVRAAPRSPCGRGSRRRRRRRRTPSLLAGAGLLQHLVGLADARRGADEDLQLADAPLLAAGRLEQGVRRGALVEVAPLVGHRQHRSVARDAARSALSLRAGRDPSARLSASTFTRGSPRRPRMRPSICSATSWRTRSSGMLRALATRGTWKGRHPARCPGRGRCPRWSPGRRHLGADGFSCLELLDVALHAVDQRLAGRAEVRAHRSSAAL